MSSFQYKAFLYWGTFKEMSHVMGVFSVSSIGVNNFYNISTPLYYMSLSHIEEN